MSVAFCPTAMGCMKPVWGSITVRASSFVSFSLQMCAPSSANFFSTDVINLVVYYHRLLRGTNSSVIEGFGDDNVHHGHTHVGRFFQIDWRVARPYAQSGLPEL